MKTRLIIKTVVALFVTTILYACGGKTAGALRDAAVEEENTQTTETNQTVDNTSAENTQADNTLTIDIPKTKFGVNGDMFGDFKNSDFNWNLPSGKRDGQVIYNGTTGTLKTSYHIEQDHAVAQYLESYDKNNKLIAKLEVGRNMAYSWDDVSAVVEGNQIVVSYEGGEPGDDEPFITVTTYRITPDLKFNQLK